MHSINKIIIVALALATIVFTSTYAFAADKTVAQGSLQSAYSSWGKPSLQGDWKIVSEGDKQFIELADNFRAKEGPDVKIFLSPKASSEISGDNATEGSAFVIQISNFEGKSRIEIPQGTNLSDFRSLVFHCEAYSKLWGAADLKLS